jgi:hypothetical protein
VAGVDNARVSDPAMRLRGSAYSDDMGEADPTLTTALTAYAADDGAYPAALAALCAARLLVPVVAVLGEVEHDEAGLAHDKSSDMATVLLTGADGRLALLAFTGSGAMSAWNPEARPVAVPAAVAAQSAVQEGAAALLIDLAGPVTLVVEDDDLVRLATGAVLARAGDRWAWIGPPGESSDSIQR